MRADLIVRIRYFVRRTNARWGCHRNSWPNSLGVRPYAGEVARPTLRVRGLLGRAEPILITGGRAVADYRD
ncbi:hypothetical protein EN742_12760, partial [Mesorhizobium sp. M4A.F.Ca.ET.020.02.1.1]